MGITTFPDEERVEINEIVTKLSSDKYGGTDKCVEKYKRRKAVTYADAVRTVVENRDREATDYAIGSQGPHELCSLK